MWTYLMALGIAVAAVGWADLALLWYPLNFGNEGWEFGIISTTFEGLPLGTVGLALFAVGGLGRNLRIPLRVLAVVFTLIAISLLCIYVIYLLDVPLALRNVQAELLPALKKGMAKTTLAALTYTAFYSWSAWYLWRKTRAHKA